MGARGTPGTAVRVIGREVEGRYGLPLDHRDRAHLADVAEHYAWRRDALLREHGEAGAMRQPSYAKAVLVCEAARLMLREIEPRRRRKKRKEPL